MKPAKNAQQVPTQTNLVSRSVTRVEIGAINKAYAVLMVAVSVATAFPGHSAKRSTRATFVSITHASVVSCTRREFATPQVEIV